MSTRIWLPLCCATLLVVGCAKSLPKEAGRSYDDEGEFSYVLPSDWHFTVSPLTKYRMGMAPPKDGFAPNVVVIRESGFPVLAEYVRSNMETAATLLPDMKELERGPFRTDSGREGFRILFENTVNGIPLRQCTYFFVESDRQYAVTCTAKADGGAVLDEVFSTIVASFRIEPIDSR